MARKILPTVREFQSADLPALQSLIHRTITVCYPGHYCPEAVRFFVSYHDDKAVLTDAGKGCIMVLDRAGRLLGTGTLAGDEIKRVFVDPTFQRQGFGRRIMERLEAAAAQRGVRTVKLDASLPSKAFYDKLGYTTVEAAFLPLENGRRLDFFKMQKTL